MPRGTGELEWGQETGQRWISCHMQSNSLKMATAALFRQQPFAATLKASRRADVHRDELRQPGDCASCTRPRESNLNTPPPVKAVLVAARKQEAAGARLAICADHAERVEWPRTRPSWLFLTVPGVIMSRSKSRRELQTCVSLATVPALRNRWYQAVHSSDGQAGTGACEA